MNIGLKNKDFKRVCNLLMIDKKFLRFFIDDPEQSIQEFDLEEGQRRVLLVRHVDDLPALGIEKAPPCGIKEEEW